MTEFERQPKSHFDLDPTGPLDSKPDERFAHSKCLVKPDDATVEKPWAPEMRPKQTHYEWEECQPNMEDVPDAEELDENAIASGDYNMNAQETKFPEGVDFYNIALPDCDQEVNGMFGVGCREDQLEQCLEVMFRQPDIERATHEDLPIGSWRLWTDKYKFADGVNECQIWLTLDPAEGMTRNTVEAKFDDHTIDMTMTLAPHISGERVWKFEFETYGPIVPDKCRFKIYDHKDAVEHEGGYRVFKRVKIVLVKAEAGLWKTAGTITAPTTKHNYRDLIRQNGGR